MNNLVKKYLLHLQYERGLSSNTINSYSLDLNKYLSYLKEKFSIIEPNEIYMKHIKSFTNDELQYIVNNKSKKSEGYQYSSTTISRYFSSIRGFHSFLLSEGMCNNDPSIYLDKPKVNKKIPNYLEFNDIKKILNSVDLESKIDTNFSINTIKNKLETFSDKHFKSALIEFTNEIQNLKNHFPNELCQLEMITDEIKKSFNDMLQQNVFDKNIIHQLQTKLKDSLRLVKLS